MSKNKRDANLYFQDIIDSIEVIEEFIKGYDLEKFSQDRKTVDAVIRNVAVIGEAINNLPEEIKIVNPQIPWDDINGMRNKIIHEYFGVNKIILWQTINEDLPELKKHITKFIK